MSDIEAEENGTDHPYRWLFLLLLLLVAFLAAGLGVFLPANDGTGDDDAVISTLTTNSDSDPPTSSFPTENGDQPDATTTVRLDTPDSTDSGGGGDSDGNDRDDQAGGGNQGSGGDQTETDNQNGGQTGNGDDGQESDGNQSDDGDDEHEGKDGITVEEVFHWESSQIDTQISDVMPGHYHERTVPVQTSNDSHYMIAFRVGNVSTSQGSNPEAEGSTAASADPAPEMAQAVHIRVSYSSEDDDGRRYVIGSGGAPGEANVFVPISNVEDPTTADGIGLDVFPTIANVHVEFYIPASVGNEIQGDELSFTIYVGIY